MCFGLLALPSVRILFASVGACVSVCWLNVVRKNELGGNPNLVTLGELSRTGEPVSVKLLLPRSSYP